MWISIRVRSFSLQTQNADATTTIVASLTGDQGNQWYSTAFEITSNGYEIVFEGVVGPGEEGDIAIDNVKMIEGNCGGLCKYSLFILFCYKNFGVKYSN